MQAEGNTLDMCSIMAFELFPLSFWRDVTADTARALFGTIFFVVEITKGYELLRNTVNSSDVWQALKERRPAPLGFSYDQQRPPPEIVERHNGDDGNQRSTFLPLKLGPILPSKIRLSFPHRQSINIQPDEPAPSPSPILRLPEFSFLQNDLRMTHHASFPRAHHSLTSAPRACLHNPRRELEMDATVDSSDYLKMMSLPLTPNATINSPVHRPIGDESSTATSTRASLISVVTDSLVLGSLLESTSERVLFGT